MSNCKQTQAKLEVAEGIIKQMGEPVWIMYKSRISTTSVGNQLSSLVIPLIIGIALVFLMGLFKPTKVEQPTVVKTKTEIEF